jgi:superfamily I DNA/RNA helicase
VTGIGQLDEGEEEQQRNARLLYVGMTRAQDCLFVTTSRENRYSRELLGLMPNELLREGLQ